MYAPFYLFAMAFTLVPPAFAAEPVRFDHHDPAALNEEALRRLKVGDRSTALILLERGATIFQGNETIRRNLHTVRAYIARPGTLTTTVKQEPAAPIIPIAKPLPESPSPWPNR